MSSKDHPRVLRDRQQRVPSGPRPSPSAGLGTASTPRSNDTFMTAPSRGIRLDDIVSGYDDRIQDGQAGPGLPSARDIDNTERNDLRESPELMSSPTSPIIPLASSPEVIPASLPSTKSPRMKPAALRLNTFNLLSPSTSPNKPLSPGLQHWQQVRDHVMTPAEERMAHVLARNGHEKRKVGLVSKAAGKFGIKQAAEHVIRGDEKRKNTMAMKAEFGELSEEQRDEIARERRRFARDVKACLDACSADETKRRLTRLGKSTGSDTNARHGGHVQETSGTSLHGAQLHPQRQAFDNDFYAFAPLLTELHRHMPAARVKKPWSRTCPHHAAILAELSAAFLDDGITTTGERQQALEVFGTVVRHWAADSPEEELSRWTWLCRVLIWDDRQLRERGLSLLQTLLQTEAEDGGSSNRQHSATSFISLLVALLRLLYAVDTSPKRQPKHFDLILDLIHRLGDGTIVDVDGSTLRDLVDTSASHGGGGGNHKELVWIACGSAAGKDVKLAEWLVKNDSAKLRLFVPSPLLHGSPPVILQLRSRATSVFFRSFATLVANGSPTRLADIWQASRRILEPEIALITTTDELCSQWANFLLSFELTQYDDNDLEDSEQSEDPFRITLEPAKAGGSSKTKVYREVLGRYWQLGGQWERGLRRAAQTQTATAPLSLLYGMVRSFLVCGPLKPLGQVCLQHLLTRLSSTSSHSQSSKSFLRHLQATHPQLLYKSLFTCAAAISSPSLGPPLKSVLAISDILEAGRYWTDADPQMVAIVLMGNVGTSNKGKHKEGHIPRVTVKLGRYAVLVLLLKGLDKLDQTARAESRLKIFAEQLDSRIAVTLEAEEKEARLPDDYRALVCALFRRLRSISGSVKRSTWRLTAVRWYLESQDTMPDSMGLEGTPLDELRILLSSLESIPSNSATHTTPQKKRMTGLVQAKRKGTGILSSGDRDPVLDIELRSTLLPLLVLIQGSFTSDDWMLLVPPLWAHLNDLETSPAAAFLFIKCVEKVAAAVQDMIMADTVHESPPVRSSALRKIAKLYGWRYQILSQRTNSDRRGPIFHFSMQNLAYVSTEIGLPHWIQPQEVQDAALQKFGNTLPLELRQRLMGLGWNEDDDMVGKSDWEHLPITSLPSLQMQADEEVGNRSPSPIRLHRSTSSDSGHSVSIRRRKPLFAPALTSLVGTQAMLLADEVDPVTAMSSRELLKLLQRDDATTLFRVLGERFDDNLEHTLAIIRAGSGTITPGFAYAAINALIGHARAVVRSEASFPAYVDVLTTIAALIHGLSGVSLRDIRKNRSEMVLLPASIHEDQGGYKLHAPWREGAVDAQTAQLLILGGILRNNPRDVYLVKKMLSNLQIQSSIHSVSFSRTWLLLNIQLFSTANRNYNDRAELRHFLSNVSAILRQHGRQDLLVVAHSMRVLMLCSARFRRVYASVGFQSTMGAVFETYSSENEAIRDCVEYAMRSFYRIHGDSFVHLACVTISESTVDPENLYNLLASLSLRNTLRSGAASGVQDMNKKEEIDALVHMISGPELAFSEIGTAAAERHASKVASVNFEETVFPKPNIVKLFITVVAASPASKRAIRFLGVLADMIPFMRDEASRSLLQDSVEAMGRIVVRGKASEDAALRDAVPHAGIEETDWIGAKAAYLAFADVYAQHGGRLSNTAVKRILQLVPELLRRHADTTGSTASSIIGSLAKTYLSSARPAIFLRDIAPTFRTFMTVVDFSGLLDHITELIRNASFDLDTETTSVIIDHYVRPSISVLGSASEDNMAFVVPLRSSTVHLLSAAVFLRGDAWLAVEQTTATAGLLASVILPFSLMLEPPKQVDRDSVYSNLWIRILHFILSKQNTSAAIKHDQSSSAIAARQVLVFQITKIVCLRAPDTISSNRALWLYLATRLEEMTKNADDYLAINEKASPRIIEWMKWTLFELLSLYKSPLMLHFRPQIQTALSVLEKTSRPTSPIGDRSRGSSLSPSETSFPNLDPDPNSRSISARHQRVPSFQHESNLRKPRLSMISRSRPSLPPDGTSLRPSTSRLPSYTLRRSPNPDDGEGEVPKRPAFGDISARRSSRPSFDVFQSRGNHRFPSSATVRQVPTEKGKGAIIHLLGAPTQVSSALSGGLASPLHRMGTNDGSRTACEMPLKTEELIMGVRRAVKAVQIVFGYDPDMNHDEEPVRAWSAQEALHVISEQTKLFVESEFGDLFNPSTRDDAADTTMGYDLSFADDSMYTTKKDNDGDDDDECDTEFRVPILNITPA